MQTNAKMVTTTILHSLAFKHGTSYLITRQRHAAIIVIIMLLLLLL